MAKIKDTHTASDGDIEDASIPRRGITRRMSLGALSGLIGVPIQAQLAAGGPTDVPIGPATTGKLRGRIEPQAPPTFSVPRLAWTSATMRFAFEVTLTSAGKIGPGTTSGNITATVNGLSSNDRIIASARLWSNGLIFQGAEPNGLNSIAARFWNPTGSSIAFGTRQINVDVIKNDGYRQVFALSRYLGKDCWLAAVDMQKTRSACILKSSTGGPSPRPIFAVNAHAIRNFVEITANSNRSNNDTLNTTMIALLADPGRETDLILRTTDAFETTQTYVQLVLSTSNPETMLCAGDVEGGQGNGSGSSYVIVGSFRPHAPATAFVSTTGATTFAHPVEIAPGTTYDTCWAIMWIKGARKNSAWRAFLHDSTGVLPPAIFESIGGSTWSPLTTVGVGGNLWQGVIKLSTGTILAGIRSADGGVYRSTDSGSTFTKVFSCASVIGSDTKPRAFVESDGVPYMASQDAGHLWRGEDDGRTWTVEYRISQLFTPICMSASRDVILIGGGRGLNTGMPGRAEMYVSIRMPYRHQPA